jgi:hypothetical protein
MDSLMTHFWAGLSELSLIATVIEGFDQFGFGLGGVEVGRCRRYGLLPLCFLFLSLS